MTDHLTEASKAHRADPTPDYPDCDLLQCSVRLDRHGRCTVCHLPDFCHEY